MAPATNFDPPPPPGERRGGDHDDQTADDADDEGAQPTTAAHEGTKEDKPHATEDRRQERNLRSGAHKGEDEGHRDHWRRDAWFTQQTQYGPRE